MKKRIVLLNLFILLFFIPAAAQPKTATKPAAEIRREFVHPDKSFKISFPEQTEADRAATEQLRKYLNADERFEMRIVGDISYGIAFSDFAAAPVDEMERDTRYELKLSELGPKTKDVTLEKKYAGVETVTEIKQGSIDYETVFRLFLIKQRFFVVSAAVPSLKKMTPAARAAYQAKIDKFFDSLNILEIPAARNAPTPLLPADFKISLDKNAFRSDVLKIGLQMPADWKIETHEANAKPDPEMEKHSVPLRWNWRNREGIAAAVAPDENASFGLLVVRKEFADVTLQKYAQGMAAFLGNGFLSDKTAPLALTPMTFGGRDFLMLEEVEEDKKKRKYFAELDKNWILEIHAMYRTAGQLKTIEASLGTLKF